MTFPPTDYDSLICVAIVIVSIIYYMYVNKRDNDDDHFNQPNAFL